MKTIFGLKNMEIAQKLVRNYVLEELYPDLEIDGKIIVEGPGEFEVQIVASTGLTTQEDFRIYLTTTLPDGMLYEVTQLVGEAEPRLTAYKDIKEEEPE